MTVAFDPHRARRVGARRPRARLLLAPSVWGTVLMPASGFWALHVPAVNAIGPARPSAGRPITTGREPVLS